MIVGYIGLGVMGQACANNLLKAGHTLRVNARCAEQMQALIDAGATPHDSPAALAAHCDIIHSAKPGSVVVD